MLLNPSLREVENILRKAHKDVDGSVTLRGVLSDSQFILADGWYDDHHSLRINFWVADGSSPNDILLSSDESGIICFVRSYHGRDEDRARDLVIKTKQNVLLRRALGKRNLLDIRIGFESDPDAGLWSGKQSAWITE